ncbi:HelD family protein [Loigolactobacillus iwatensis]|uniref:HelD family protein n=1 Tax=Loigolactobacillus iwatensis TaxID=1267156 RepID=UPI000F7F2499|nr:UvrD-helicase domain-containing protein [Loigolactobacillus iwatensis]
MDKIFNAEQTKLKQTYQQLLRKQLGLQEQLAETKKQGVAAKSTLGRDIALNFDTDIKTMETLADIESRNREIDTYNFDREITTTTLDKLNLLLEHPYFAKVNLQFSNDETPEDFYIGAVGMTDENDQQLIIDWRSPIAETYYNQKNGPTTYRVNQRTISTDLKLRRQFQVQRDQLQTYFDTTIALEDPLLRASLSKQQTTKMQAITATIQKEQNTIIRYPDVPVLLVNGIAGSGKTSVLLQRIAYLLYQKRGELLPDDIYLFTPNTIFQQYISTVLPNLGERNPINLTWDQFIEQLGLSQRHFTATATDGQKLVQLERRLTTLKFAETDFNSLKLGAETILSAKQLQTIAEQFNQIVVGPRRITAIRTELTQQLNRRLAQQAHTRGAQDAMLELSEQQQERIFQQQINPQTEKEIYQRTYQHQKFRYQQLYTAINESQWLSFEQLGQRLLQQPTITLEEWLYLKIILTGYGNSRAKFVMIDEIQDYSEAQLMILNRFFKQAHFMLLGDENQAINAGNASFGQIKTLFEKTRPLVATCRLLTSYRSTPEITALFTKLSATKQSIKTTSVQAAGREPTIKIATSDHAYQQDLKKLVTDFTTSAGLTAVIAENNAQLDWLAQTLAPIPHVVIKQNSRLPTQGTILITLQLAKGLEFDRVIIPDLKQTLYPANTIARHRLYTAIS